MAKAKILSKKTERTNSANTPKIANVKLDKVKGGEKPAAKKQAKKKGY